MFWRGKESRAPLQASFSHRLCIDIQHLALELSHLLDPKEKLSLTSTFVIKIRIFSRIQFGTDFLVLTTIHIYTTLVQKLHALISFLLIIYIRVNNFSTDLYKVEQYLQFKIMGLKPPPLKPDDATPMWLHNSAPDQIRILFINTLYIGLAPLFLSHRPSVIIAQKSQITGR